MLDTPGTFPYPDSWAVFEGEAITVAVRIMSREREDGTVAVSIAGKLGASANTTVPLRELKDATPLTRAEASELAQLEASLLGYTGRGNAASRRADILRSRIIYAELLRQLLAKVPASKFPAVAAVRRQLEAA